MSWAHLKVPGIQQLESREERYSGWRCGHRNFLFLLLLFLLLFPPPLDVRSGQVRSGPVREKYLTIGT